MVIRHDIKADEGLRKSFNGLVEACFGFDFEAWYQKGFWTDAYVPYAYVQDKAVIASASIHHMTLRHDHKIYKAIQIGTVMTREDYRGKGLARGLLKAIMDQWQDDVDFIYLFANDRALSLYESLGMNPYEEYDFRTCLGDQGPSDLRSLDLSQKKDYDLMCDYARHRTFHGCNFACKDDCHLLMFYCHEWMADCLYYLQEMKIILVMAIKEDVLHLYDVLSKSEIDLDRVLNLLKARQGQEVVFHFKPNISKNLRVSLLNEKNHTLMIKHKGIDLKEPFRFSKLSRG